MQSVEAHNAAVAQYAMRCLAPAGLSDAVRPAALVHDAGKFTPASCDYQWDAARGKPVRRGSVIHTFQGCRLLLERHNPYPTEYADLTSELLAYAAAAHHGLFDLYSPHPNTCKRSDKSGPQTMHGFHDRIQREGIQYAHARRTLLEKEMDEPMLRQMFLDANNCLEPVYQKLEGMADPQTRQYADSEYSFYLGLLSRLLLSAVIEGDRRDTAEFMTGARFPDPPEDLHAFWHGRLLHMETMLDRFSKDTPIQRARRAISDQCRAFAEMPRGVYRLHVPTGSGKTLSSLRFALAHAAKHGKRRIFFVAPLLTILEQNAKIWREYIGSDDMVLEHHSNVFHTDDTDPETLNRRELLEESWDVPVVITTMVQFLNTLFSGGTACIRRFWALCDSVIVLDEVQTIPTHMLTLFNLAVNFLSEVCGATFVLCSATQPCLEKAVHPLLHLPQDVVPYDSKLWEPFRRTQIVPCGNKSPEQIEAFCEEVLQACSSLLIVCNKRSQAKALFDALSRTHACFHLSASMCPAHRRDTLRAITQSLERSKSGGAKTVCVSTQVIEAGVDVSFARVIRITAGLDNIIQSAGRCNRNGESDIPAPVYVVSWNAESLDHLQSIARAKAATVALLEAYRRDPARFRSDLSGDAAAAFYYSSLYTNLEKDHQDYIPPGKTYSLFDLLSENDSCQPENTEEIPPFVLCQSFRTAGQLFQVFDENSESVMSPYGEGADLIAELASAGESASIAFLQDWLQRAKPYMLSVYPYQMHVLEKEGMYSIANIRILCPEQYDTSAGLVSRANEKEFLEV